jgi:hypothetical protein
MLQGHNHSIRRLATSASALAIIAMSSATALAQPTAPASVGGPPPGFVTLDRGDARSFLDASLARSFFEGADPDFNVRMELYYQYVTPSGTGGYVSAPFSYLSDNDESGKAFGNVEIGGLHNLELSPKTDLVFRGGVTIPTAPGIEDDINDVVANLANATARITDYLTVFPETTALRLAASPVHRSGQVFVRGDGGVDIVLDSPGDDDIDPLLRINLGVGVLAGKTAVAAEFATLGTTGDVDDGEDRFLHTLAITVRHDLQSVQLFGALVLPVNADFLNVDTTLIAGGRIPF